MIDDHLPTPSKVRRKDEHGDIRPLKSTLAPEVHILSSRLGAIHKFDSPQAVAPLSSFELQLRLAQEFRKGSCDPSDPPPTSNVPLDPDLFSGYTGIGDPEELTDEDAFEFRCLLSAARGGLRAASGGDEPDGAAPDEPGSKIRGGGECPPRRDQHLESGRDYGDEDDHDLRCPELGAGSQLDGGGTGDSGSHSNPMLVGLLLEAVSE